MAGSTSAALLAAPVAGLFPKFEDDGPTEDAAQAWDEHHRAAEPYPTRQRELAEWVAPDRGDAPLIGHGEIMQTWHYSAALSARAAEIVAEYEAHGGRFNVVRQSDEERWFGTLFARDGSPEAGVIEFLLNRHEPLRRAVGAYVEKRNAEGGAAPEAASAQ